MNFLFIRLCFQLCRGKKDIMGRFTCSPRFSSVFNKPWMIYGDFIETLKIEEHSLSQNNPLITAGMRNFQDTVRYGSLSNMKFHAPLFTWCNKRDNDELICNKLDRVLVNDQWILDY